MVAPEPGRPDLNLYLAGMRGSGKTTVGRAVAALLGWPFVDLDAVVQQRTGATVAAIFARAGESGFRQMESAALAEVAARGNQVVALGGGACLAPGNRQLIRRTGRTVWLQAEPSVLGARIAADPVSRDQRPPLGGSGPDDLAAILAARRDGYADCAGLVLATGAASPEQLASLICRWWQDGR